MGQKWSEKTTSDGTGLDTSVVKVLFLNEDNADPAEQNQLISIDDLRRTSDAVIDISYAEAIDLQYAGDIIPGALYRMTDFKTLHKIPGTSERNDTNVSIPVEVLVLTGLSTTTFEKRVYSESFPSDIIEYTTDNTAWKDLQIAGQKGCITYRLDTKRNIRIGNGDWRNFIIRKWACDMSAYGGGAIEWVADANWGFYAATVTHPVLDLNLYNAGTNPDGYKDLRIATWQHVGDAFHPVNVQINSREFWDAQFPMPSITFNDGASECIVRDVNIEHALGACTFKNTIDLNIDFADQLCILGTINYLNNIHGNFHQTILNITTGANTTISGTLDCAIFSLSGTAAGGLLKIENIYQSLVEITNITSTGSRGLIVNGVYNSKIKLDKSTDHFIEKLAPVIAYPSKVDFTAQTSNIRYTETVSTYETTIAAASSFTLSDAIINIHCGVINLTGSGVVNISTIVRGIKFKQNLILKPASGLTINIAYNNVANGFVQTEIVSANGTNGEQIILTPTGDRWIASGDKITAKYVTAQFNSVASTTLSTVPELSYNVLAGETYVFKAKLFVDSDAVGGQKFCIGGTATATAIKYQINAIDNTTNAYVITSRQTALGGASGQAGSTASYVEINGTITVNAAGTLTVQFAQNAAAGTSSVLTLSSFEVQRSI